MYKIYFSKHWQTKQRSELKRIQREIEQDKRNNENAAQKAAKARVRSMVEAQLEKNIS